MPSRPPLPKPALMLVTDRHLCAPRSLAEVVAEAVAGGVNAVQLREKDLGAGELLALAVEVKHASTERALLIVNDRVDVALAMNADGVQLPESGLPVAAARKLLGPGKLIGRSVHSLEGASAAERAGADYLIFGPVYPTSSHPGAPPAGLEALKEVTQAVGIPVVAIGGITSGNVRAVLEAGAAGTAVVSAIIGASDPGEATAELVGQLKSYEFTGDPHR